MLVLNLFSLTNLYLSITKKKKQVQSEFYTRASTYLCIDASDVTISAFYIPFRSTDSTICLCQFNNFATATSLIAIINGTGRTYDYCFCEFFFPISTRNRVYPAPRCAVGSLYRCDISCCAEHANMTSWNRHKVAN